MKVLIINPGAVSTKIAVYDERTELFRVNIEHDADELRRYSRVVEQTPFREEVILRALHSAGYELRDFDAICSRGGLLRHIPSGTYAINDRVLADIENPPYGEHASNLGAVIAKQLADQVGIPAYFVDPVSVDEMSELAHISGFAGMQRESFFHALNQKSTARRLAAQLGRAYEELNLIVVHLGGGVSVAAHQKGVVIDDYNVKDDGSMGMDRSGALPVNAVINLCYSGKTKAEGKKLLGYDGGVYSYLGTKDFREVERRAFSGEDAEASLIFRAFAYQLAKDIGAMAAVLRYKVDAIVYTGGMAHSERFCNEISSYVGAVAPVYRLPGENEMQALAEGALRVLHGEPAKEY